MGDSNDDKLRKESDHTSIRKGRLPKVKDNQVCANHMYENKNKKQISMKESIIVYKDNYKSCSTAIRTSGLFL